MEVMDIDGLIVYARSLVSKLQASEVGDTALVVGLYGDLGAGKTTLVQAMAKEFGITESITSPTYVIEKKYDIEGSDRFDTLIHIDAYRLEKSDELLALNFEEDLKDPKKLILIEWADKVENVLPENARKISLTFIDDEKRSIEDGN